MWIKTSDGDYINMDKAKSVYLDEEGDTCIRFDDSYHEIILGGNHRDKIIQNIISGTKLMEVQ